MRGDNKLVLFYCSDIDEYAIKAAREYIAKQGFNTDQVRILKRPDYIIVESKQGALWPK